MARRNQLPRHDDPTEIDPRPQPAPMRGPGATNAQLKQDIDSGATGEKVAMVDPGAADLGTGAEAAGTPTPPEMIALDRRMQRMPDAPPGDPGRRWQPGLGAILVAAIAALVALALFAVAMG